MARRRALSDRRVSTRLVTETGGIENKPPEFQTATYKAFDPSSGQYTYQLPNGDYRQAEYIPGYGAEFGGVPSGTIGLLSQGFWSR